MTLVTDVTLSITDLTRTIRALRNHAHVCSRTAARRDYAGEHNARARESLRREASESTTLAARLHEHVRPML